MRRCALFIAISLVSVTLWAEDAPKAPLKAKVQHLREPFTGQIKGSKVRMRIQPDLDSCVVEEMGRGELLVVTGESGDYFSVKPPEGRRVYVYRTFVLDGVVEGNHVNLRLAPDLDAPIVGQLNSGTKIRGSLAPQNSKWLAIAPPEDVEFFIAKDYVNNIGNANLIAMRGKRTEEVQHLLNSAYLLSQSELRKTYAEIDIERVRKGFERVINEYRDLPDYTARAQAVLDMVGDIYTQKRMVEYDEVEGMRALAAADKVEAGLAQLDNEFGVEAIPELAAGHVEAMARYQTKTHGEYQTDKMRLWEPVEESLFHLWAVEQEDANLELFYEEQALDAELLTGIIEPYNRPVQNRPGDFVLRVDSRPVAYLYSTKINLEQCVGQRVTLQCVPRPNNNFAFPAYFVVATE